MKRICYIIVLLSVLFFLGCKKTDIFINNIKMTSIQNLDSIIKVKFIDNYQGFAASYNKFHYTNDGGQTWTTSQIHNYSVAALKSINYYFYSSSRLFVIINTNYSGGVIYLSSDSGKTWVLVDSSHNDVNAFALADNNNGFMSDGNDFYKIKLTNSSFSQKYMVSSTTLSSYVHVDKIIFADSARGYIYDAFNYKFYTTSDGGAKWIEVVGEEYYPVLYLSTIDFKGKIGVAAGARGSVRYTVDGNKWNSLYINEGVKGAENMAYVDCQVVNESTFMLCGNSGFIRVLDGQSSEFFLPDGTSLLLRSASFLDKDIGYAADWNGTLYKIELKK